MEVASAGTDACSADCRGGRGMRSGSPRPAAGAGGPAPDQVTRARKGFAARRPILHYHPLSLR
jgi:hypothetical protein